MGGSYRNRDAIAAYIGFIFRENLMLGYSYDFTTTDLGNYSTGTHELILGMRFNKNGLRKGDGSVPQFNWIKSLSGCELVKPVGFPEIF